MPSDLPKKTVKKTVKKILPAASEPASALTPELSPSHHGLAAITIILIFLAIGCLAAAMLMSQKIKTLSYYGQTVAAQLTASEKKNADLSDNIMTIKTLQELAKKVAAPITVSGDIVWSTYASSNISLQYPSDYTAVKATADFPALTIKSDKGRIEIFRMKDFPRGVRYPAIGATAMGMGGYDAELDANNPKDVLATNIDYTNSSVFPYNIWVYYSDADTQTKAVLDEIVASIKVVK
jgi:hypothetical protein